MRTVLLLALALAVPVATAAASDTGGPLSADQAAYDVLAYDLDLAIDPEAERLDGVVTIDALTVRALRRLELDLDDGLQVTSVTLGLDESPPQSAAFRHGGGKLWVEMPEPVAGDRRLRVAVHYGGRPRVAANAPWEGGFTWKRTATGQPWFGVSCQTDGADVWWPCKDHPSDEPEDGVRLHLRVPEGLTVVASGRLLGIDDHDDGTRTWHWATTGAINLYDVTVNAAPFVELTAPFTSVAGTELPITRWALADTPEERLLLAQVIDFVTFLEGELGPYPFRADKLHLVATPYLAMEHQTAVAYAPADPAHRESRHGYHWIALHELAHEWWGNLVSASDWRDFWLHEGFDGFMEVLYAERRFGEEAARRVLERFRPAIRNQRPVAPRAESSLRQVYRALEPTLPAAASQNPRPTDIDAYTKGAWVLHSLRWLVGDEVFFPLLRRWAYPTAQMETITDGRQCRLVSTGDFLRHASEAAGRDLAWFFEVYLRQPDLPRLRSSRQGDELTLWWETAGDLPFPMPVEILGAGGEIVRLGMEGGRGTLAWPAGLADPVLDPRGRLLRAAD
jgi:aminopeptidase N